MASTKTTRLELFKKDKSVAKVIFVQKKESFDVKICFQCDNYYIKGYKLFNNTPLIGEARQGEGVDIEVTYHSKLENDLPKIHFKTIIGDKIKYDVMPLRKLSSPSIDSFVPFPLFKIEIPDNTLSFFKDKQASHSSGRKYTEIEIENNFKIVELYMVSNESKILMQYQPYIETHAYFLSCNFECFCTNSIDPRNTPFFFKDNGKSIIRKVSLIPMGDFKLVIVTSIFPQLEKLLDKPAITFIENYLSEAIFFHCLIKKHIEGQPSSNGLYIGNINFDNLKELDVNRIEDYWSKYSLSNILYRKTANPQERAIIKQKALSYLKALFEETRENYNK